jgi:DNA-binding NtrC family response regulator
MPALRERGRDIARLARHYMAVFSQEFRRPVRGLVPEAERRLIDYSWPGNVRELRNVIERAVLLVEGDTLGLPDFETLHALTLAPAGGPSASASTPSDELERTVGAPAAAAGIHLPAEGLHLDDVEKQLIVMALERTRGNQTRAAALLGLHRDQIRYRMEKYGLLKPAL